MSALADRIRQPQPPMGEYHPYGTGATPMVMPLALIRITGAGMTYDTLEPIWTGDQNSAPIPATAAGAWHQLHAT